MNISETSVAETVNFGSAACNPTVIHQIVLQIERRAALYFDKASIYLPDFQAAYSMTVDPVDGASYEIKSPPDINGFEYEVREARGNSWPIR